MRNERHGDIAPDAARGDEGSSAVGDGEAMVPFVEQPQQQRLVDRELQIVPAGQERRRDVDLLRYLKERGLKGVRLVISDKCIGLYEVLGDFFRRRSGSAVWCTGIATPLPNAHGNMSAMSPPC